MKIEDIDLSKKMEELDTHIVGSYKNGNYYVVIGEDGTKVRVTEASEFIPNRLESCDCKITGFCDMGCEFCFEKSTKQGEHADLDDAVIDTFPPYTEVAIGGGNPLSHPQLETFLKKLKDKKCFANITVNQVHFLRFEKMITQLVNKKLIYGLGISISNMTEDLATEILKFPNAVCHVIAGIVTLDELRKMSNLGIKKVLFLGYKQFGRGKDYYSEEVKRNIVVLKENMRTVMQMFSIVSFDNRAINQLGIYDLLSKEEWENFYMGDDGSFTMYIDLVEKKYAQSSTSTERFDLKDNINDMFLDIRKRKELSQ